MPWKFNPFTGSLDYYESGGGPAPTPVVYTPDYPWFLKKITVFASGSFRIDAGAGTRISSNLRAAGFTVQKNISILANGSMRIQSNARGTVLGV